MIIYSSVTSLKFLVFDQRETVVLFRVIRLIFRARWRDPIVSKSLKRSIAEAGNIFHLSQRESRWVSQEVASFPSTVATNPYCDGNPTTVVRSKAIASDVLQRTDGLPNYKVKLSIDTPVFFPCLVQLEKPLSRGLLYKPLRILSFYSLSSFEPLNLFSTLADRTRCRVFTWHYG